MKSFLFLLLFTSCVQSEMITVTVGVEPDFKVTRHGVFQLTSIVPDFDHVYDSINFSATNLSNNKQTLMNGNKPEFNFAASPADFNVYMGTKNQRRIERYVHFSASVPSIAISSTNKNVTLTSETQQGLILIVKAGVQSVPSIKVGTMERVMYSTDKYYYAYVWDDGHGAKITTTIDGVLLDNIVIGVTKGVVYVFNPLGVNVKVTDPFGTVQQI